MGQRGDRPWWSGKGREVEQQGVKEMEWGERVDNGERSMEAIWEEIKEIKKVVLEMEIGKHLWGGLIGRLGEMEGKVEALMAVDSSTKHRDLLQRVVGRRSDYPVQTSSRLLSQT